MTDARKQTPRNNPAPLSALRVAEEIARRNYERALESSDARARGAAARRLAEAQGRLAAARGARS